MPNSLPSPITCLGTYLVAQITPWGRDGRAHRAPATIASTLLRAKGGVRRQKDRKASVGPHSTIDTHWPL